MALVIEKMAPERGGRERSVAEIAAGLAGRGHDVAVLCREGQPFAEGVRVRALGSAGVGRSGRMKRFAAAVRAAAEGEGFDVLHATLPLPGADVYQPRGGTVPGQIAARGRLAGPAGRLWRQATLPLNRGRRLAWKWERQIVADRAVTCLAVSQMVAEEFATYYGRREDVRVIYSGVEIPRPDERTRDSWRADWRGRWGADDDTTVFLTVAQNFALKGVGQAIHALADYLQGDYRRDGRLVVVGGDRDKSYRRLAAGLGVGQKVVFAGGVADVFPLYSAADAVVLLSWQDACSRVVLEAIRWGVPSLTTCFNGAAELLARGAGRVVGSPRDRPGIVAAMAALADPAKRRQMTQACRAIADFAGMDRQLDELERVYAEVAER